MLRSCQVQTRLLTAVGECWKNFSLGWEGDMYFGRTGSWIEYGKQGESNLREKCSDFWLISYMCGVFMGYNRKPKVGFQRKVMTLILDVDERLWSIQGEMPRGQLENTEAWWSQLHTEPYASCNLLDRGRKIFQ